MFAGPTGAGHGRTGRGVFGIDGRPSAGVPHGRRRDRLGFRYQPRIPDRQQNRGARRIVQRHWTDCGRRHGVRKFRLRQHRRSAGQCAAGLRSREVRRGTCFSLSGERSSPSSRLSPPANKFLWRCLRRLSLGQAAVSYTHLDVYKRQGLWDMVQLCFSLSKRQSPQTAPEKLVGRR